MEKQTTTKTREKSKTPPQSKETKINPLFVAIIGTLISPASNQGSYNEKH